MSEIGKYLLNATSAGNSETVKLLLEKGIHKLMDIRL